MRQENLVTLAEVLQRSIAAMSVNKTAIELKGRISLFDFHCMARKPQGPTGRVSCSGHGSSLQSRTEFSEMHPKISVAGMNLIVGFEVEDMTELAKTPPNRRARPHVEIRC